MAVRGFEYAFEDLSVNIDGTDYEVQGVEYGYTKEHTNIKGRSGKTVTMARGKEDAEKGKISLLQSDFESIQAGIPKGKNVTHLAPFIVTISYAPIGGKNTTDQWKYTRVNGFKKGLKNGDGNQLIDLDCTIGELCLNI